MRRMSTSSFPAVTQCQFFLSLLNISSRRYKSMLQSDDDDDDDEHDDDHEDDDDDYDFQRSLHDDHDPDTF